MAMSYFCPVVIPPVGGVREVVGDSDSGLIVDPLESSELDRCLFDLLSDESHYRHLATAARLRAKAFSNFDGWSQVEALI